MTYRHLIDGELRESSNGSRREILEPATNEPFAEVAWAGGDDVELALAAAERAKDGWRRTPAPERVAAVRELASRLRESREPIAQLESRDSGNPIRVTRGDVSAAASMLEYMAGLAPEIKGISVPSERLGAHYTVREPLGVVTKIIAFNHPILFSGARTAAPLVAGNCVVLKPAPQDPLTPLLFGELAQDVFPPGVLNVLAGGSDVGDRLCRDPRVRRIGFTGSREVGKLIMQAASEHLAEATLELGGKNPLIVLPDVDVQTAARAAVASMNYVWQGQSCGSASRIFVHRAVKNEFEAAIEEELRSIRVGLPTMEDTGMGPLVSQDHHSRVCGYIERGRQEGADLVVGGSVPDGEEFQRGNWLQPTAFTNVTMEHTIAREEIFGPVMSILPWEAEEDVIAMANDTVYGLTANVWTDDLSAALRIIDRLEAGYTYVNGRTEHFIGLPFGGYKQSGIGSEESLSELLSYTQEKSISLLSSRFAPR